VLSELPKFAVMHVKQTNPKNVQDILQSLNEYSKEYGFAIQDEESTGKAELNFFNSSSDEPAPMTSKIEEKFLNSKKSYFPW